MNDLPLPSRLHLRGILRETTSMRSRGLTRYRLKLSPKLEFSRLGTKTQLHDMDKIRNNICTRGAVHATCEGGIKKKTKHHFLAIT